ncbi:hypothetical protein P43SY_003135 [Pythium insidiosum]|uniref:Uncharacterized protein n=1 Tax=Pythium insidiosum TaxID=114742 RepID=A0AAD5LB71_PYTIN|nr:hypothetical protein P43SY_003135 [Pythium insidiosum]
MFVFDRGAASATRPLPPPPPPPGIDALHAQRTRLAALLQVHPLSPAVVLDDSAPPRVDAVHWGHELRARARETLAVRRRRLRSPAVDPSALLGLDEEDVEVLLQLLGSFSALLYAQEEGDQGEAQDRCQHDDGSLPPAPDALYRDPSERARVLREVRDAVGCIAAELLLRWQPRARVHLDGAVMPEEDAAQRTADEIVGFLLQFRMDIGAFHAFHLHKLVPSVVTRAFRHAPHWRCSVCARKWSVRSSSPSGPGISSSPHAIAFRCAICPSFALCHTCFTRIPNVTRALTDVRRAQREFFDHPTPTTMRRRRTDGFLAAALQRLKDAGTMGQPIGAFAPRTIAALLQSIRPAAIPRIPRSPACGVNCDALIGALGYSLRERVRELQLYRAHEMAPLMEMLLEMIRLPAVARCIVDHEVNIKDKTTMFGDSAVPEAATTSRCSMWMPQYISASQMRQHTFLGPLMAWTSLTTEFTEIRYTQSHLLTQPGLTTFIAPQWVEAHSEMRKVLALVLSTLLGLPAGAVAT